MSKERLKAIFAPLGLAQEDLQALMQRTLFKRFAPHTLINQKETCLGFILVLSGGLRAYIMSENAKEITLFTLKENDICLLCSHCALHSINYDILLESSQATEVLLVPQELFSSLKDTYPALSNFALTIISKRLSQTISTLEQALFKPLVERIREFLHENAHNKEIRISHEEIANHLGSSREVISRILKEMENKGEIKRAYKKIILLP
ncbi:Crp/Fnr family transcriptional regulator [Helicobacter sp. MIT 21-1697]|uniref:Crp/Fnr family transcriptional regulator n=1 Tax=Helicobacter sp. MIT 21-1697 TaxID=2993733 RepID=UPI00224AF912|nr:Crp/Fnr family transcriptional regulator [Helicobacter sp. MIT 21-1697]MCX2717045.1 Crp/Fnr family transcriptional regulator [Helicobacter sp. MIT 21-1697]